MNEKSLAQVLGPLIGAVYVLAGIAGFFVTGFDNFTQNTNEKLLIFQLNPMHNVVHLGAGLFLVIMCSLFSAPVAEGACMGAGLFLIVAFVIGVSAPDNLTIISMFGEGDAENFNHIVIGVTTLAVGLISSGQTQARMKRQGLTA
jgi:hypothetical protein